MARLRRLTRSPVAPLVLLALVSLLSLGARTAAIGSPCTSPCTTVNDHDMVFDEVYYVNAARRIDGLPVPAGQHYSGDPAGQDPNSEHPQLAKLVIAGSIELFDDGPFAWRLGSLIFGSLAILGMFALVLAAGGTRWCALLAATLMACDNLLLVAGRIGTLDIYVVAFMIWAAVLYLRSRPLAAGVLLGIGACTKEVAPYLLAVLVVFELGRLVWGRRLALREAIASAARRFGVCVAATAGSYLALLALLDRLVPPFDPQTSRTITGGPIAHIEHMLSFAVALTSPRGPTGIASYPWDWLVDLRPINYLTVTVNSRGSHVATVHFLGFISPPILALAVPALALGLWRARGRGEAIDVIGVAWFLGTWLPFVALSVIWSRTSYLYYMVIVMPGLYIAVARLMTHPRVPRLVLWGWLVLVAAAAVVLYPFTAVPVPAGW
ncbi:MAG: glycosyltransferase family 39 protein [Solirubrobacteraceae bacterium]